MSQSVTSARFPSFDGRQIAYEVFGAGPETLLLHGFASDHLGNWVRPGIVDALVTSGRRVIAYDARGHGASDKPHDVDAYEHNAMVRDAQALLDLLGVTAVDVVGYSMGAIVSSRLVGGGEPRARSLVLGGVGGRLGRALEHRARTADALQARERPRRPGVDRAFRRFAERNGNDLDALAAVQRAAAAGTPGDVGAIRVPTLCVAGADDQLAGPPQALADKIPGAVAVVIPGNHLSAVARPLAEAIVEFLARVSPV
jgi:pimeloyl-ACP methyl ester carboxylesterase